ncbi:hypothetical protein [Spirosoma sordidisoli]|uniref:Uncharacterized protein n=1 Tax=Spirosoma sordidisoli TaxID=2502893 RepID=A0A4Q2USM8_9BACT|nr:hypothetical protein [Spirosoma sordidisoli]RYC70891.1 hypothetical protein EQG79_01690 [Spirosoma sordidisoli]
MKHYPHAPLTQLLIVIAIGLLLIHINRTSQPGLRVKPARVAGFCVGLCLALLRHLFNRI